MKLEVKYPDYLSIKDWKYFSSLEGQTDASKMINFISYITDTSEDELKELQPQDIKDTYAMILQHLGDVDARFFPVIEIEKTLYGFASISKMTLGEYMDLERLAKESTKNLEEIMAILYRPIKKHSFKGIRWAFNKTFKTGIGKVENLFKYYTLEKYDSTKRPEQADVMAGIPVSFALGCLSFFLVLASSSLLSIQAYSIAKNKQEKKMMMDKIKETLTVPIGDGLLQYISYQKHPSLQSQEIRVSQI